eukprot:Gb_11921 [translate_table: standard]
MAATSIGIMDGAYFVGRNEILSWINNTLNMSLSKVEEGASGAVYCQLMDACHPGAVPMHKVNFEAKSEYEMIQNYKVLQDVFNKLNIGKHIEVNKLVKGRPLDNLEFMQWMKRYCDTVNIGGIPKTSYNATERRESCRGGKEINKKTASTHHNLQLLRTQVGTRPPMPPPNSVRRTDNNQTSNGSYKMLDTLNRTPRSTFLPPATQIKALHEQIPMELITMQIYSFTLIVELKLAVDNLEKERDFYFGKLRDIEILCQSQEHLDILVVKTIQRVLYADEGIAASVIPGDDASRYRDTDQDDLALYDSATEYKGERLEDSVSEFKGNGDEYGWVEDGALNACTYVDAYTLADPEHRILCNSASVEDFLPSVE